jgi:hypothetical protein
MAFWAYFSLFGLYGSLLKPILNNFKNNLGPFLVLWACLIFFEVLILKIINFILLLSFYPSVIRESNTTNQTNVNITYTK